MNKMCCRHNKETARIGR